MPDEGGAGSVSGMDQSLGMDGQYNQQEGSDPNNKQPRRRSKKVTEG